MSVPYNFSSNPLKFFYQIYKFTLNKAKRSAKQLRSDMLICFRLLALRISDRMKWLPEKKQQLQGSVVNCAGPQ